MHNYFNCYTLWEAACLSTGGYSVVTNSSTAGLILAICVAIWSSCCTCSGELQSPLNRTVKRIRLATALAVFTKPIPASKMPASWHSPWPALRSSCRHFPTQKSGPTDFSHSLNSTQVQNWMPVGEKMTH